LRPIRYPDRAVALCAGDHVLLGPEIAVLEPDHPRRRFVALMCVYSAELDSQALPAFAYCDADAERYARDELMPDELLEPLAGLADHELAKTFVVPLEQIQHKRQDRRRPRRRAVT
jgi:hypothetical protein